MSMRQFTLRAIQPATPVKSIWRSRGYGYVIDLTADKPDVYVETDALCWHTDLGNRKIVFDSPDVGAYYLEGNNKAVFTGAPRGNVLRI